MNKVPIEKFITAGAWARLAKEVTASSINEITNEIPVDTRRIDRLINCHNRLLKYFDMEYILQVHHPELVHEFCDVFYGNLEDTPRTDIDRRVLEEANRILLSIIFKMECMPYPYRRVLEIIYDYWISEPDEEEVKIEMCFKHHDGMEQTKCITWRNPKFQKDNTINIL